MKKIITFCLMFFCCSVLLFSAVGTAYLRPMSGAAGIPLNPPRGNNNRYTPIRPKAGSTGGIITDKTYISDAQLIWDSNVKAGSYTDDEMIAIGGYSEFTSDIASTAKIHVTATCNNGFYMVSQSNPSYKRPFELYLIPKARNGSGIGAMLEKSTYGQYQVMGEGNNSVDISYSGIMGADASPRDVAAIWFDLVLVLDGTFERGDVLNFHGKNYPLAVADDYSAIVNLSLQPSYVDPETHQEVLGQTINISIPFTGFYSSSASNKRDELVSMFVRPLAAAGNIDMKNYQRQNVADIQIKATYEYLLWDSKKYEKSYCVFLSSHNDPFTAGEKFKLVKDDVEFPMPETATNSVGYDVILSSPDFPEKTYDGTQCVPNGLTIKQLKDYPFAIAPSAVEVSQGHRANKGYTYDFGGIASIKIHDNSGTMMEAGRYVSSIYIHVVDLTQ